MRGLGLVSTAICSKCNIIYFMWLSVSSVTKISPSLLTAGGTDFEATGGLTIGLLSNNEACYRTLNDNC